ncbi:MAG TPA: formyltransferase family protein [Candidatus Paceibacterota bacterium]|nr:formyltransferase family protein [Candidatus Paceibacterota bacterium]
MIDKEYVTKILYIGLDPETPIVINKRPIQVIGVSSLEYFSYRTLNPANLLFTATYRAQTNKINKRFTLFLFWLWKAISFLSTYPYKKYSNYLSFCVLNSVHIIDVSNEESTLDYITENRIELIVVNSWSILPQKIVTAPTFGTLNIHPSKLPMYKGALPTLWSLKNGDSKSAVTYQKIGTLIDGGDIISQYEFNIDPTDTSLSIELKISQIIKKTLFQDILNYTNKKIILRQQQGIESWTEKYSQYMQIDWEHETSKEIADKTILYPFLEPFCYCYSSINANKVYFKRLRVLPTQGRGTFQPGQYIIRNMGIVVTTYSGNLFARLFIDVPLKDSLLLLFNSNRRFEKTTL